MSQEKDILSLYSESPITAFTENDVFEGIGVRLTENKEVRELVEPNNLKFVKNLFGVPQDK